MTYLTATASAGVSSELLVTFNILEPTLIVAELSPLMPEALIVLFVELKSRLDLRAELLEPSAPIEALEPPEDGEGPTGAIDCAPA